MSGFVIFKKLSIEEAVDSIKKIEQWFKDNPTRKVCRTDLFKIRRGFVGTDVLERTKREA